MIPGVAIATALMPPLCTAGFGLATGNLLYFLGAFYLYFINSVFISLATYIGVRLMRFERKQFVDKERERIVKRYIVWITIATMCPAVYLTYNIVRETFYQTSANRFITQELQFPDSQILSRDISYEKREIRVVLVGKEIPENQIVEARNRLDKYSLNNTKLVVFQGLGNNNAVDISNIKSMVMEDFYHNSERQLSEQRVELDSIKRALDAFSGSQVDLRMGKEMKVLFPMVKTLSVSKSLQMLIDSARMDTVTFAIVGCTHAPSAPEKRKMNDWLKARTGADKVHLIVE